MPEQPKRGRRPAPNPRKQRTLALTDAEWARVEAAWQRFTHGRMSLGEFTRLMLLAGVNDPNVWGSVYLDSGQADADEAAETAADLAEARAMIERGEVGLGPVTN